ncbi:MAG: glycosyltransferase family 2 protein [Anaerolineales bacterium]
MSHAETVQQRKPITAAIIPVYNEERNVGDVLEVLRRTDLLDELILVDDGSTDRTTDVLHQAALRDRRIQVIRHERNKGKGQAMFTGWAATSATYLVMLDADLKNLKPDHIPVLLDPILQHRADMTLGLFSGGHLSTDLSHRLTPFLTGQRGLRSEIMKYISREAATGYGFEVTLTIGARQQGYRTKIVTLKGVWHPSSELRTERGFWKGSLWKLRMYGQIVRAWYIATHERPVDGERSFSSLLKP